MPKYYFADIVVDIENSYDYITKQCIDYIYTEDTPANIKITITEKDIRQERLVSDVNYSEGYLESICTYRKLALQLPFYDALLLHASAITVDGKGIAFLAPSGIGKTTHTLLWRELLGDQVEFINGDKPIIRFINDIPYAYGTPWAGKEGLQTNQNVILTDLCFIERSEVDEVEPLQVNECIVPLMHQMLRPSQPETMAKTLELADRLLKNCNLWKIKCTKSIKAAETAYSILFGDTYETKV